MNTNTTLIIFLTLLLLSSFASGFIDIDFFDVDVSPDHINKGDDFEVIVTFENPNESVENTHLRVNIELDHQNVHYQDNLILNLTKGQDYQLTFESNEFNYQGKNLWEDNLDQKCNNNLQVQVTLMGDIQSQYEDYLSVGVVPNIILNPTTPLKGEPVTVTLIHPTTGSPLPFIDLSITEHTSGEVSKRTTSAGSFTFIPQELGVYLIKFKDSKACGYQRIIVVESPTTTTTTTTTLEWECVTDSDCPDSRTYYECQDGNPYKIIKTYTCEDHDCNLETDETISDTCSTHEECVDGEKNCQIATTTTQITTTTTQPILCNNNVDCQPTIKGTPYCLEGNIVQSVKWSTCENPATSKSKCVNHEEINTIQVCTSQETCTDGECKKTTTTTKKTTTTTQVTTTSTTIPTTTTTLPQPEKGIIQKIIGYISGVFNSIRYIQI